MRKRDYDVGDNDGNCKIATIYIALCCAKHCAKHFTFAVSFNLYVNLMR